MSDPVDVRCERAGDGWQCHVTVRGGGAPTRHEVAVSAADLARLDPRSTTPDELVLRSFAFLLAREPGDSILRRFDLTVIARYFPEWEQEIGSDS